VPIENVIVGYHRAAVDAAELGVSAALILCFLRDFSAESAVATLTEALPYKDRFIGVGLDSDERDNPPAKFAEVFALARAEGLKLTMHCDIDQVGSIENIRQVLEEIGVDRIDHGTNIVENPALVELLLERGIGLTCCPVSNSFVTEDMKATEMVTLLRQGVAVTVNSDDPAYFGAYIADNYVALVNKAGLGIDDVVALAKNSFAASWLDDADKARFIAEVDAYVAAAS
jgi:adenosine deaminase